MSNILLPILIPLSWVYGLIIWIRNFCFDIGLFKSTSCNIPIISIGNIVVGGTGKTPLVIFITKLLLKYNYQPGIVSRGYGRNSNGTFVSHDGNQQLLDVASVGDEPFLMGKEFNNIPIIVSENKIEGITELQNNFNIDIIILDDAFQHRKVTRDIDIVTVSADYNNDYHLLPWGKLREPLKNIKRANHVIYTKTKNYQKPDIDFQIQPFLKNISIPSIIKPTLMKVDKNGYHKTIVVNEKLFAFCGIANPNSFFKSIKELGLEIEQKLFFSDHYKYNIETINNIVSNAKKYKCNAVITTEKDLVKIPISLLNKFTYYIIKIQVLFKDQKEIMSLISPIFSSKSHKL